MQKKEKERLRVERYHHPWIQRQDLIVTILSLLFEVMVALFIHQGWRKAHETQSSVG